MARRKTWLCSVAPLEFKMSYCSWFPGGCVSRRPDSSRADVRITAQVCYVVECARVEKSKWKSRNKFVLRLADGLNRTTRPRGELHNKTINRGFGNYLSNSEQKRIRESDTLTRKAKQRQGDLLFSSWLLQHSSFSHEKVPGGECAAVKSM